MRPPFRRFLAASALAALLVPTPALADPMFWALRQTEEGAGCRFTIWLPVAV